MTAQERFEALQERWKAANEAVCDMVYRLKAKYGYAWRGTSREQQKLESLRKREDKAADAIHTWLDAHSPRDFRRGCPAHWVYTELTYADAITSGQMAVIPPVAYGYMPIDSLRFAAPIQAPEPVASW